MIGRYFSHGALALQKYGAAEKLVAAIVFSVGINGISGYAALGLALFASACFLYFGGTGWRDIRRTLIAVNIFLVFLWITLPFFLTEHLRPEDRLIVFGRLSLGLPGLLLAGGITMKANAMAGMFLALVGSSSVAANAQAMLCLRVPAKLVTLLLVTYAHLGRMQREYWQLLQAARLRGFCPRSNLASYRIYAYLASMLLVRSWQRAERVNMAMRLRGFCGKFPLLEEAEAPWNTQSTLLCCGICCTTLFIICIEWV